MRAKISRIQFYVANIKWTFMRKDLADYFKKYGRVSDVVIPMDYTKGMNKRFALVAIHGKDDFEDKVLNDRHTIKGQELMVSLSSSYLRMQNDRAKQSEKKIEEDKMVETKGKTKALTDK